MHKPEDDLALAERAARAAGSVVMQVFRTDMKVTHKSPDQPLTDADLAADKLLREALIGARPEYGWLSEETADTPERLERELVWLVDPIDGTRSFIAGHDEFTISIGLARNGAPILGVVFNPATNEMFTALHGEGAYKDGRRLRVGGGRDRSTIVASRTEIKRKHFLPFEDDYDVHPLGSTAYKLSRVAEGTADVFMSRGPKGEWDLCAGDLSVREAGGAVTDLRGQRLQYNQRDPHIVGVLAARTDLHAQLIERLEGME